MKKDENVDEYFGENGGNEGKTVLYVRVYVWL